APAARAAAHLLRLGTGVSPTNRAACPPDQARAISSGQRNAPNNLAAPHFGARLVASGGLLARGSLGGASAAVLLGCSGRAYYRPACETGTENYPQESMESEVRAAAARTSPQSK